MEVALLAGTIGAGVGMALLVARVARQLIVGASS